MVATKPDLDASYDLCQRITKAEAKNFYYAFRTLPSHKRRAIYAAYAFCRVCDDISDEDLPLEEKIEGFTHTRKLLARAHNGESDEPVIAALADTASNFSIPWEHFDQIVAGVEIDLIKSRYATFDELREYCYKVASVVGLVSIKIFGYEKHPEIENYAIDLGLAMQLTNILRDIKEDAARDRIYIPQKELKRFNYSEQDLMNGVLNESFRELIRYQMNRARGYFESGRNLIPLLSQDSRACTAVLIEVYSSILNRIAAADYDVFSQRIGLSTGEKLFTMTRLWALSFVPSLSRRL
jgi:phytoene synthase